MITIKVGSDDEDKSYKSEDPRVEALRRRLKKRREDEPAVKKVKLQKSSLPGGT